MFPATGTKYSGNRVSGLGDRGCRFGIASLVWECVGGMMGAMGRVWEICNEMEWEKLREVSGKLMDGKELEGESQRAAVLHLVLNRGRPRKGTKKNPPPKKTEHAVPK